MKYNVLQYLEESCMRFPEKIAFEDENEAITYSKTVEYAKRIASYVLRLKNYKPNAAVAILIDRNIDSIVSFFGVVYAGCFYVPIDLNMPKERVDLILESVKPIAIIDSRIKSGDYDNSKSYIDLLKNYTVCDDLLQKVRNNMIDEDPLYAIFTSGSTGVPKGVLISHRSVIDLLDAFNEAFHFENDSVFCNQAPFDFDVSVKDIYNSIYCGGKVVVAPKKLFMSPKLLVEFLVKKEINTMIWAVSALKIISDFAALDAVDELPKLRYSMFSGEVMPPKSLMYWKKHFPNTKFVNLYGPTEITCNCTYYIVDRDFSPEEKIPAGKPFTNTRIKLIDESGKLITEAGQLGEICVSGRCLALGYWSDFEKTEKSFPKDPFVNGYSSRMYKTGDLGQYDDDGNIVFSSRKDHQIKHMGHRIELGEIEAALNSIPFVTTAVCIYIEAKETILCFYQADEECKKEIIRELGLKLPKYMWPNVFVKKEVLPLNKNGKIDRIKLKKEWETENG